MKKIFAIALISSAFFTSCDKAFEQPADWSSLVVIQASPVATTAPSDTLNVFVDTSKYTSSGILYNANSGYLPIRSGSRKIDILRGTTNTSSNYISTQSYNFERGQAYSFFVYDTTTSTTGQARVLRLKDNLTLPAANMSHVRFLNLAPNSGAVDVTLLRTSATPNDSVTISNKAYVGASPDENALAAFMAVPRGTYTAKVKIAGTQTVLTSATVVLTTGANVAEGRIVTIYLTGTAKNRAMTIGSFRHY